MPRTFRGKLVAVVAWVSLLGIGLTVCRGAPRGTPDGVAIVPQGVGPSPDDQISGEGIDRVILEAGEADPNLRHLAQLRVRNLPAKAYEKVKEILESDEISPEIKITLRSAAKALSVRYNKYKRTQQELQWNMSAALAAYEQSGSHNKTWDADARAALSTLGQRHFTTDEEDAREKLAAFRKAAGDDCQDPLIVGLWVEYQLAVTGWAQPTAASKKTEAPAGGMDPRTQPRMKTAMETMAASSYPARFKCQAYQTAAKLFTHVYAAHNSLAKRAMTMSRDVLGEALKTPGYPVQRQFDLVVTQYQLEVLADPKASRQDTLRRLFPLYTAAAPGAAGPLLFRAAAYVDWARAARGNLKDWPTEKQRKQCLAHLKTAEETLETAWKLDPSDARVAVDMISVRSGLDEDAQDMHAAREQMEKWFTRAMQADPDNYSACLEKMNYLMPLWEEGDNAVLDFARECAKTENFRGRVAVAPALAHVEIARRLGNPTSYFARPHVWDEIQETYDTCLKIFPNSTYDRSMYARLALAAGKFDIAHAQFAQLGDAADLNVFGGQPAYDAMRVTVAVKARALARGDVAAPASDVDPVLFKAWEEASMQSDVNDEVAKIIRTLVPHLPELQPTSGKGNLEWQTLTLNKAGQAMDCVRFHTPGQPRDLRMAAIVSEPRYNRWAMLDLEKGFLPIGQLPEFLPLPASYYNDLPIPKEGGAHTILLRFIPASWLEPNRDYVLWYRFHGPEPVQMSFAMTFVNPTNKLIAGRQMVKDLGLKPVPKKKK